MVNKSFISNDFLFMNAMTTPIINFQYSQSLLHSLTHNLALPMAIELSHRQRRSNTSTLNTIKFPTSASKVEEMWFIKFLRKLKSHSHRTTAYNDTKTSKQAMNTFLNFASCFVRILSIRPVRSTQGLQDKGQFPIVIHV